MPTSDFDQLQSAFSSGGAEAALKRAADLLREQKKYHELFEVLKMQVRRKLGLPLLPGASDELPEETRTKLEDGLISSCREVGSALLKEGKIREGWMYLRPVGDRAEAAGLMGQIAASDENYEDLIEICLHEGVDIGRGYGLVLEHYGTCNAITQYDSSVVRRPRAEQVPAAKRLLAQVHADLVGSVKAVIDRQEGQLPKGARIRGLVKERER